MRLALLAALFCGLTVPAFADSPSTEGWQAQATRHDLDRLARYEDAVTKGMMESQVAGEENGSYNELVSVMEEETIAADPAVLAGQWSCRTIKAGGPFAGFVVYGWFRCDVVEKEGRLFFEKLSGSQRQSGYLYPRDQKSWVLLATPNEGHSGPVRAYSGPEGPEKEKVTDPQLIDEPGVVSLLADGRARAVFPWPELESTFNVLEMKRR